MMFELRLFLEGVFFLYSDGLCIYEIKILFNLNAKHWTGQIKNVSDNRTILVEGLRNDIR